MVSIDVITEDSIHCTHGNGSQHARRLPEHPEKSGGTHLDEWGGSVRGPEEVIQLEIIGLGGSVWSWPNEHLMCKQLPASGTHQSGLGALRHWPVTA